MPISTEGGTDHVWSPDGRAIFYRNASQILRVSLSEEMVPGTPEVFVEADVIDFDVFPDGDRLIAIRPEGSGGWNRLHVVLNWFEELETERAPGLP